MSQPRGSKIRERVYHVDSQTEYHELRDGVK
jgi:hypothetical protein